MYIVLTDIFLLCFAIFIYKVYKNYKWNRILNAVKDSPKYERLMRQLKEQNAPCGNKIPLCDRKVSFLLQFAWLFCFLGFVRVFEHRDDERNWRIRIEPRGIPIRDLPGGALIGFIFWETFLLISVFFLIFFENAASSYSAWLLFLVAVFYWFYSFTTGVQTILLLKNGIVTRGKIISPQDDGSKYALFLDKMETPYLIPYPVNSPKDKKTGKSVIVLYNQRNPKHSLVYDGLEEWNQVEFVSPDTFVLPSKRFAYILEITVCLIIPLLIICCVLFFK